MADPIDPQTISAISKAQAALTGQGPNAISGVQGASPFDPLLAAKNVAATVRQNAQNKFGAGTAAAGLEELGPAAASTSPVTAAPTGVVGKAVAASKGFGAGLGRVTAPLRTLAGPILSGLGLASSAADVAQNGVNLHNTNLEALGGIGLVNPGAAATIGAGEIAGHMLTPAPLAESLAHGASATLGAVPGLGKDFGGYGNEGTAPSGASIGTAEEGNTRLAQLISQRALEDKMGLPHSGGFGAGNTPPPPTGPAAAPVSGSIPSSQGGAVAVHDKAGLKEAADVFNGDEIGAPGTGFVRNNTTGNVTKITPRKGYGADGEPVSAAPAAKDYGLANLLMPSDQIDALKGSIQTKRSQEMALEREKIGANVAIHQAELAAAAKKVFMVPDLIHPGQANLLTANTQTGTSELQKPTPQAKQLSTPGQEQATFDAYIKQHGVDRAAAKKHLADQGYDVSKIK